MKTKLLNTKLKKFSQRENPKKNFCEFLLSVKKIFWRYKLTNLVYISNNHDIIRATTLESFNNLRDLF